MFEGAVKFAKVLVSLMPFGSKQTEDAAKDLAAKKWNLKSKWQALKKHKKEYGKRGWVKTKID